MATTPRTRRGRDSNGEPPPPQGEPLGPEDFLAMPPLELVQDSLGLLRRCTSTVPQHVLRDVFQRIEALHQMMTATADPALLTPIQKLSRDLKEASRTLGKAEARFLTDAYYSMQENRIRSAHQVRTLAQLKPVGNGSAEEGAEESADDEPLAPEPHDVLAWLYGQEEHLEGQIRAALDYYSASDVSGVWARSIKGIGPVIAAGLLANIDIEKAPTVGHIWRFAGLDPTAKWLGTAKATELVARIIGENPAPGRQRRGGDITEEQFLKIAEAIYTAPERLRQRLLDYDTGKIVFTRASVVRAVAKRPWNAGLKRLCFLIGDSFVKVSNRPDDVYGKLYKQRKEWETERNQRGLYRETAEATLAEKRFDPNTDAYGWYSQGMLPPARIHLRAQRRAVKIFLSHLHEVLYWARYEELPPHPYVLDNIPGHAHLLRIPNLELMPDLAEAKARRGPPGR